MTQDPDLQATQPKPAEGGATDGPPPPEQGSASGRSSQAPSEGADDVALPTEGSPVG